MSPDIKRPSRTIRGQSPPSLDHWISALDAATQLECDVIRTFSINTTAEQVNALEPASLVRLGLRYGVAGWAKNGFARLIDRDKPLSSEEGAALGPGLDRVLAICRCRETLSRGQGVSVE